MLSSKRKYRQSIENTENNLEVKLACLEENLANIESRVQEICDYQLNPAFINVEDRLKRNNLRLVGIKEVPNETWEDGKKDLHKLFQESLGIKEEVIRTIV